MKIKISKGRAKGDILSPPSKSYAHRLLICSALAEGNSKIKGISESKDMEATLGCIRELGAECVKKGDSVSVNGGKFKPCAELNCYESGSTLRFIIPVALINEGSYTFFGSERLFERGIGIYEEIFEKQSIKCEKTKTSIKVEGKLKPDTFYVRGDVSSQFISGLLFALPLLDGDSKIIVTTKLESRSYIDITIDALKMFGVEIEYQENTFYIKGGQKYKSVDTTVEGDMSNSAFLDAFNYIGSSSLCVNVLGLNESSKQGDRIYKEYFELLNSDKPTLDLTNCPDLGPIVFALAGVKHGAQIKGTKRLKIKESDRVGDMAYELSKFGIEVVDFGDSVSVNNKNLHPPDNELDGHNDHRIVMALSVILTLFGGVINGCEAVTKSYPDFFEAISSLGIKCEVLEK